MDIRFLSILLGLGGMVGWGLYDFLGGLFSRQMGAFRSLFWSQLAGLVVLAALTITVRPRLLASALIWALCLLAALAYSTGYLFFFKGFEKGNVSIVAATMNLWAVFTMLFAFLFMGQRLTALQTLGAGMILSGAALASMRWDSLRKGGVPLSNGVKEAVQGAFFFGIFWNISEILSEEIGWLWTTLLVKAGIALFLLALARPIRQGIRLVESTTKTRMAILLAGVVEAGAVACVNYGLVIGDAILITPIASALSIVTITLALVFLKEKISGLQASGILLAVCGIIAMGV